MNNPTNAFAGWFDDYGTLAARYGAETIRLISVAATRAGDVADNSPDVYDSARISARYAALALRAEVVEG